MNTIPDRNYYTEADLRNVLRLLWIQNIEWTRFLIISQISGLDDIEVVKNRYFEQARNFANLFSIYFGEAAAENYENLLRWQYKLTNQLITDLQSMNESQATLTEKKLHENADRQAAFLSHINNYWNEESLKNLLYDQIDMTRDQILRRIHHDYANDVFQYDLIQYHALMIADIMWTGFLKKFYQ